MSLSGFGRGKQAKESNSMNVLGKESGTNLLVYATRSGLSAESFNDSSSARIYSIATSD